MIGVVLWSSKKENEAIIWCEDHGELAFFNGEHSEGQLGCSMDAGDLVSFELTQERRGRRAFNPRVISEQEFPMVASTLAAGAAQVGGQLPPINNVIPFPSRAANPKKKPHPNTGVA